MDTVDVQMDEVYEQMQDFDMRVAEVEEYDLECGKSHMTKWSCDLQKRK